MRNRTKRPSLSSSLSHHDRMLSFGRASARATPCILLSQFTRFTTFLSVTHVRHALKYEVNLLRPRSLPVSCDTMSHAQTGWRRTVSQPQEVDANNVALHVHTVARERYSQRNHRAYCTQDSLRRVRQRGSSCLPPRHSLNENVKQEHRDHGVHA